MDYAIGKSPEHTEIRLNGRLTFTDHERFRELVANLSNQPGDQVAFDLSGLEFIDSSGLGMLIIARDAARRRGFQFRLTGAQGEVMRLLTVSRFHNLFEIT